MHRLPRLRLSATLLLFLLLPAGMLPSQEPPESAILPDEQTAVRAKGLIRPGSAIRLFCDRCRDQYVQEVRVVSVTLDEHPREESSRWVLRINGGYLPIEEIYLRIEGEWRNLAHLVGLAPEAVPETMYPFLRAVPVPPRE